MSKVKIIQLTKNPSFHTYDDEKLYRRVCKEIEDEIAFKKELGIENFKVVLKTQEDLNDNIFEFIPIRIYSDELFKGWNVPLYFVQCLQDSVPESRESVRNLH